VLVGAACSLRRMERLWAPWRMTYIGGPRADGCVFCAQAAQSDEDALIVHRGERCYAVLNLYPYGSGHLMIVPFRHVAAPGDLDADERIEFWELDPEQWVAAACRLAGRNLTQDEWQRYGPKDTYRTTCP